jgi:large subunit ribosomal protein L21
MYAVIKTGGKQYRVTEGQTIKIEQLNVEPGATLNFDRVLMMVDGSNIQVGAPFIENGNVSATVLEQGRHKKIRIIKFRRRKHYMKRMGHRQNYTEVKITKIGV